MINVGAEQASIMQSVGSHLRSHRCMANEQRTTLQRRSLAAPCAMSFDKGPLVYLVHISLRNIVAFFRTKPGSVNTLMTGARAKAWCLLIHADASLFFPGPFSA